MRQPSDDADASHIADRAKWAAYGKMAGPFRNQEMVDLRADQCIAFLKRGAKNKGTKHCATLATVRGMPVKEIWA